MSQEILRIQAARWGLITEGEPIKTPTSWVYFVRYERKAAALKIFKPNSDEKNSGKILAQYNGEGAVNLLKSSEEAILTERPIPGFALANVVLENNDDAATKIFCETAKKLHAATNIGKYAAPVAALTGTYDRYTASGDLTIPAETIKKAKTIFKQLCATQKNIVLLHGDLHHDHILYDEVRGWLAIDPKGYLGEAEFEAAAFLKNPQPSKYHADEKIVRQRIDVIAQTMNLTRARILAWAFSYYVMSVIWDIERKTLKADWQNMLSVLEKMLGTKTLML